MLRACKRVLRPGGRTAFHVILLAPDLGRTDRIRALAAGPPHMSAPGAYPDLLVAAGFVDILEVDVTDEYRATAAAWFTESGSTARDLETVYGTEEFHRAQEERRETLAAIDAGLLRRSLFAARAPAR